MEPERREHHAGTDESRAGSTPHVVRWILFAGLFLAIGALTIIWVTGALSQGEFEQEHQVTTDRGSLMEEGNDPAIILSEDADEIRDAPEAGGAADEHPLGAVEN